MAGSNVNAAARTMSTAAMVPTARPFMNGSPTTNRPSNEMTTVLPANSTARPEVLKGDDGRLPGIAPFAVGPAGSG